ncbi:MAG: hypothetical protein GY703_02330 [Gammaproteobacteria bacterium]|nr:hypothetical protein [Gammaproteobacteria bacterium]
MDNQGTFEPWMADGYEVLQRYTGSSTIPGLETLFDVTIGAGYAADQSVGIAVDFVTNLALELDDAAASTSLIDEFTFDSATNTFTLLDEFTIFDGLFPRPVGVTDFDLSFNVSSVLTSEILTGDPSRFVYEPYRDGNTGTVPVPAPTALIIAGLIALRWRNKIRP